MVAISVSNWWLSSSMNGLFVEISGSSSPLVRNAAISALVTGLSGQKFVGVHP